MKRRAVKILSVLLTAAILTTSAVPVYATETTDTITGNVTVIEDENKDDVTITKEDKPYLALGADLSDAQKATVLSIMGIPADDLADYDVVYVTNAEEHQYLEEVYGTLQSVS